MRSKGDFDAPFHFHLPRLCSTAVRNCDFRPARSGADGPARQRFVRPEVPTVWHKLGIPQGVGRYKKFRESRINRKGNNPQREKTPKLVKLTDAANLDPEAPKMLQAAAKIKMAEDLAPQKLKALKYLATIGCGCYNKKNADMVEAAVLEGLDDCTIEVRREALDAGPPASSRRTMRMPTGLQS